MNLYFIIRIWSASFNILFIYFWIILFYKIFIVVLVYTSIILGPMVRRLHSVLINHIIFIFVYGWQVLTFYLFILWIILFYKIFIGARSLWIYILCNIYILLFRIWSASFNILLFYFRIIIYCIKYFYWCKLVSDHPRTYGPSSSLQF